jgi:hypothetical protein
MLVNMGASTDHVSKNIPQKTMCTCIQQITPKNNVACYLESQRGVAFRSLDSKGMKWHGMEVSCV